mmetsp:Transcript_95326/g.273339  ORF Transcript_95326/g.273339 Transcript_95326/m.273339 type:complete len:82 (-) Transcript_95326:10-255(-)
MQLEFYASSTCDPCEGTVVLRTEPVATYILTTSLFGMPWWTTSLRFVEASGTMQIAKDENPDLGWARQRNMCRIQCQKASH